MAPGSVDPLGWSSLVRCDSVASRPWGDVGGWVRALWKTVAVNGCARPSASVNLRFLQGKRRKCGFSGSYKCYSGVLPRVMSIGV